MCGAVIRENWYNSDFCFRLGHFLIFFSIKSSLSKKKFMTKSAGQFGLMHCWLEEKWFEIWLDDTIFKLLGIKLSIEKEDNVQFKNEITSRSLLAHTCS